MATVKQNLRLEELKKLLVETPMRSQQQVIDEMKKRGYSVTQATLSRDFKRLKVAKAAFGKDGYAYVLPEPTTYRRVAGDSSASNNWKQFGLESVEMGQVVGVIKTKPGHAGPAAYNIDSSNIPEILGTVAGDDTVIFVGRKGVDEERVERALYEAFLRRM